MPVESRKRGYYMGKQDKTRENNMDAKEKKKKKKRRNRVNR